MFIRRMRSLPVHPHACGEHRQSADATMLLTVHPHACGEHIARPGSRERRHRFIPTPVGNTHACSVLIAVSRFIPTPVGNTPSRPQSSAVPTGSSPRLWGTLLADLSQLDLTSRFIPTPVGNTPCMRMISWPHRRFIPTPVGNTERRSQADAVIAGSSPRLWGTRQNRRSTVHDSVHPHACGEHCSYDA